MKYRLLQRKNPQQPTAPQEYYAVAVNEGPFSANRKGAILFEPRSFFVGYGVWGDFCFSRRRLYIYIR
jgi:hypothetical protein